MSHYLENSFPPFCTIEELNNIYSTYILVMFNVGWDPPPIWIIRYDDVHTWWSKLREQKFDMEQNQKHFP